MRNIVLASSSKYRQALLKLMGISFSSVSPDIPEDEISKKLLAEGKTPGEIAAVLSLEKARVVSEKFPECLIIAGDQLVSFAGRILGKPQNASTAFSQLQSLRGHTHELVTELVLMSAERIETCTNITRLKMKDITDRELENYLALDMPFDCAGSYKIEQSGLVLFESVETSDFSAIQGIPMIWLSNRLKEYGYEFFKNTVD